MPTMDTTTLSLNISFSNNTNASLANELITDEQGNTIVTAINAILLQDKEVLEELVENGLDWMSNPLAELREASEEDDDDDDDNGNGGGDSSSSRSNDGNDGDGGFFVDNNNNNIYAYEFIVVDKDRVITVVIIMGMFGGLVGGPIASLVYYNSAPEERFYLFIIPEIVGFICAGLMVYFGKLRKSND